MNPQPPCLICERVATAAAGTSPWFVAELQTGYVVLGDHQFFRGYTLLLAREHVAELHDLPRERRLLFLAEMSDVAEAVFRWARPQKLNYELLGNSEPHLHWHLFPRHADDPLPRAPAWLVDPALSRADSARPSTAELAELRRGLLAELRRQPELRIARAFEG